MSSIDAWNEVHKNRQWGTCPEPAVARWAMRRWGGMDKDAKGQVSLLEVGCGVGGMAFWLANNGFLVDAIDSSEHAIRRAGHLYGSIFPHSLHFWPMSIVDLPPSYAEHSKDSFDGVVDVCCLQHVDDIDKALESIREVLKSGGCLFSIIACADHANGLMVGELAGATFRRLTAVELYRTFSTERWSKVKVESMSHTDNGRNISHWIVEATK